MPEHRFKLRASAFDKLRAANHRFHGHTLVLISFPGSGPVTRENAASVFPDVGLVADDFEEPEVVRSTEDAWEEALVRAT